MDRHPDVPFHTDASKSATASSLPVASNDTGDRASVTPSPPKSVAAMPQVAPRGASRKRSASAKGGEYQKAREKEKETAHKRAKSIKAKSSGLSAEDKQQDKDKDEGELHVMPLD